MSIEPTVRPDSHIADANAVQRVIASSPRPSPVSPVSAALLFGWRGMLKVKHVPEQLIDSTITPVFFVLLFTYLFGGAVAGSTARYLDYVLAGVLVMSVLFNTVYSGVAMNADVTKGVSDRLRSLPIWTPAPLVGSVLGDSVRYVLAGLVIVVVGLILGFRPRAGLAGMAAAVALVVVFAFALSWVFTTIGLILRSPSAVSNGGFMTMFPLTFVSNVFIEPATLPGWLRAFVELNPVTLLASTCRGLMHGGAEMPDVVLILAIAAGITVVFGTLTTRLYRRG